MRAQIKSRQQDVSCSVCRPHAAFFNFTVSRSALLFYGHTSVRTLTHTHWVTGHWSTLTGGVQGVRSAVVTCAPSSARTTAPGKLRYWGRISIYGNNRGWGGVRDCECGGGSGDKSAPHTPPPSFSTLLFIRFSPPLSCFDAF